MFTIFAEFPAKPDEKIHSARPLIYQPTPVNVLKYHLATVDRMPRAWQNIGDRTVPDTTKIRELTKRTVKKKLRRCHHVEIESHVGLLTETLHERFCPMTPPDCIAGNRG